MEATRLQEFRSWAAALGHDSDRLESGEEVISYLEVSTAEAARALLSHATPAQRTERQKTFFHPAIAVRSRLGQGMHDRGEAFVWANGVQDETDRHGLDAHLPLHVKAISVLHKTVAPGETWDVSVRGNMWGLDDMEELYTAANVGTLLLERGGRLVVRGNVFLLLCQRVITHAGARICILPTPFSVDYGAGPMRGADGAAGRNGAHGSHGRDVRTGSSILGPRLAEPIEPEELHGGHGADGLPGNPGRDGRNGGMSKLAELTLRQVEGFLTIYARPGEGGVGGVGGDGGNGAEGGNGADGCKVVSGVFPGGNGGNGGNGGAGGRGGHGGNGGLSSNIYVDVPPPEERRIIRISLPSQAGKGGAPGRGGPGGRGGAAGKGPEPRYDGVAGRPGRPGLNGQPGANGRNRPAPIIFLNAKI